MTSPLLLDCTLRDGGFVNDWNFGFGSIKNIISRLDCAGVDIIEVGFIDERRSYDENRTVFPDTKSLLPVFKGHKESNALIIGMIDYGTCDIEKISCQSESFLDGIRLIFKKRDQNDALHFLEQTKNKGYKIFINPVSITEYTFEEIHVLLEKINNIKPYAVSIVDTYGLMHTRELMNYYDAFDQKLDAGVILGYHAHNNFQMAYANSIGLMNRNTDRVISIDGSLYGMGKSAGNACTELLAMYMNECCGRNFDIYQLQEAIDVDILKEFAKKPWGYNFGYYIAALHDCHPSYVQYLLDKKTVSVKAVNEILERIKNADRLSFNKQLAECLYLEYQNNSCDDTLAVGLLQEELLNKRILLLGPGKTLQDHSTVIDSFVRENNPTVVSINFLNESFPIDYVFMGNAKRYSQFFHEIYRENTIIKIICTSNITGIGREIDYVVNYSALLEDEPAIRDNPLVMFLNLLRNIGVKEVNLAGFDGYTQDNHQNYYDDYVRLLYCQENVVLRNEAIRKKLCELSRFMKISSLTPTRYM